MTNYQVLFIAAAIYLTSDDLRKEIFGFILFLIGGFGMMFSDFFKKD